MSAQYDMTIDKSATFVKNITWKENGTPINLEFYDAIFTIKTSPSSDEKILEISTDSTGDDYVEIDGTSGIIEIIISPETTTTLAFDLAYYDLLLTDPDGLVTKLLRGRVSINE